MEVVAPWRINFQPDAPDNLEWDSRQDIRRLRDCSVQRRRKRNLGLSNRRPELPGVVFDRLMELVCAAACASVREQHSSHGGAAGSATSVSLRVVRQRLAVLGKGAPLCAPPEDLVPMIASDHVLARYYLPADLRLVVSRLRSSSARIGVEQLQGLFPGVHQSRMEPHGGTSLGWLRRLILKRFNGDARVVLQVARSFSSLPSDADVGLMLEDWLDFVESLALGVGAELAENAFAVADFRGQGLVPASEILFEEVHACRQWLHDHLGTPLTLLQQFETLQLHRTQRQRKHGTANSMQWLSFLKVNHCVCDEKMTVAMLNWLDVDADGEVKLVELLGLPGVLLLENRDRKDAGPPGTARA